jgi:hypothetical protein
MRVMLIDCTKVKLLATILKSVGVPVEMSMKGLRSRQQLAWYTQQQAGLAAAQSENEIFEPRNPR